MSRHRATSTEPGSDPPGFLMDPKQVATELGITRAAAETIIRQLPKVEIPNLRKIYIRRQDLERFLEDCTVKEW